MKSSILIIVLALSLATVPGWNRGEYYLGVPACPKEVVVTTCEDIATGLNEAAREGINIPAKLTELAPQICTGINNSDPNVRSVVNAFLPIFDGVVSAHPKSKGLALVDIALHLVINHLPVAKSASSAAADTGGVDAASEFAKRESWGCKVRKDRACP